MAYNYSGHYKGKYQDKICNFLVSACEVAYKISTFESYIKTLMYNLNDIPATNITMVNYIENDTDAETGASFTGKANVILTLKYTGSVATVSKQLILEISKVDITTTSAFTTAVNAKIADYDNMLTIADFFIKSATFTFE